MRFHVVRVDEEAARLVEEARRALERVAGIVSRGFETGLRTGQLEDELARLGDALEALLAHGVTLVETALERVRLLTNYAHALRVRIHSRPRSEHLYLAREYSDFVRHLSYVREVLDQVGAIISSYGQGSGSGASASGRSRARPAV